MVSDYESVLEMVKHGYAADPAEAAMKGVTAGVEMEMVSTTYFEHLRGLVEHRQVPMSTIDAAVRRILHLKHQLGLFDNPMRSAFRSGDHPRCARFGQGSRYRELRAVEERERRASASRLGQPHRLDWPLADSAVDQMGSWVMDARTEETETPLASLRKKYGADRVQYVPVLTNSRDTSRTNFDAAITAAKSSDVVLLLLGEEQYLSGEAHSRAFLNLPGAQEALVDEIAKTGKPMVSVILAGRPLTFH